MSQLAQEKPVNLGTSARLNALSQYVLRISLREIMIFKITFAKFLMLL